jgi:CubicO group peptidase (beta-lactamase class C family)
MANLAYGVPFRTDTPTNIGSTSKQFTAFAVMLQQERGQLSLDDDIREYVPELPEFDDVITIRHLLTHTSGLRELFNLLIMEGRRIDRGDWVDRSEVIDVVRHQPALQNVPGTEWNYNNTAFALAALIVERTSGESFPDFLRKNVFEPLGMTRTRVRPSPLEIVPGASEGYTPGGSSYEEIGDLGAAIGAGGIYASVEDLQTWGENYAAPKVGSREIFDEMMTSYVLADGEETGYGYGLSVGEQRGLRRISHNGADVAHRSGFVLYPEIGAGITVQSNHAAFNSGVALQLAEAFFGDAMEPEGGVTEPEGDFDPASYEPEDFDDFVGRYAMDVQPDFVLTFSRDGATLYTQATGQARVEITPTSDSTFVLSVVEASLTFHRTEDGGVEGVTLHQNGDNHATRLDDEEAAWEPSTEELAGYAGRYFSEELETFYELAVVDGGLTVRHRRLDDFELEPGSEEDAFSGGGLNFAFERDRSGGVIGFYVANGRTRDVRFQRVR